VAPLGGGRSPHLGTDTLEPALSGVEGSVRRSRRDRRPRLSGGPGVSDRNLTGVRRSQHRAGLGNILTGGPAPPAAERRQNIAPDVSPGLAQWMSASPFRDGTAVTMHPGDAPFLAFCARSGAFPRQPLSASSSTLVPNRLSHGMRKVLALCLPPFRKERESTGHPAVFLDPVFTRRRPGHPPTLDCPRMGR
jgi:hypothetical protein